MNVQSLFNQLQVEFVESLPQKLTLLERLCTSLSGKPSTTTVLAELLRQVHSLKGSGGTYGLHIITVICHQLEDYISHELSQSSILTTAFVSNCLRHLDLLHKVAESATLNVQQEFSEVWQELNELRKSIYPARGNALVIEPSRLTQNIIVQVLQQANLRPTIATDGYRALLHALSEPYSVIITSAETPLLSGFAFSAALGLSDSINRKTPIILLTVNQTQQLKSTRKTDPTFLITKDTHLIDNLSQALQNIPQTRRQ